MKHFWPFTKHRTKHIATTFILAATLTTSTLGLAQDNSEITPTPAPSKTPSVETAEQGSPDSTPEAATEERASFSSLTQNDLSILTGNVQRPNGITWLNDQLYVSCTGDWTIYQIDPNNGQTITYIYGIRNAHTLFADTDENQETHLWVPDFQTNTLNDVTRNGVRTVTNNLSGPWGIIPEQDDTFLISNLTANTITRVTRSGEIETIIEGLRSPTGIALNGDLLYVGNNGSTRRAIEWYDLSESLPAEATTNGTGHELVTGLQNITGLTLGSDSYLYFAFSLGTRGVIGRVDPIRCQENGGCSHDDIEIVLLTELAAPLSGLTISPDGRLFVHTMFSPDIYWVQLPDYDAEA